MASRKLLSTTRPAAPGLVYTAQDVAHFCEVDLKTIHHWADAGKIAHHRTAGRHLRFRHVDVVRFLRAHGYPLPGALTSARPAVLVATEHDELTKRLGTRFDVRRLPNAALALAHLVAAAPDAIVLAGRDETLGPGTISALRADPATAWCLVVLVGEGPGDLVVKATELPRIAIELTALLGIETG